MSVATSCCGDNSQLQELGKPFRIEERMNGHKLYTTISQENLWQSVVKLRLGRGIICHRTLTEDTRLKQHWSGSDTGGQSVKSTDQDCHPINLDVQHKFYQWRKNTAEQCAKLALSHFRRFKAVIAAKRLCSKY